MRSNITYLINNSEEIVHTWESDSKPGLATYLLENGTLLHTCAPSSVHPVFYGGGASGRVQKIHWNGTVTWDFEYSSNYYISHHDVEPLPNGNVLMIAWEYKTVEQAIAAGRQPNLLGDGELWPDHIIEVEPTNATGGDIVWEWHAWDHLIQDYDPTKANYGDVASHPELVDINFVGGRGRADWTHINSVAYNEEFDQILLSTHNFGEIWVIDHSTTTEQAAGHTGGNSGKGGDLLYRWGNPQTYRAGDPSDQRFFAQHDAVWIEQECPGAGNILVFNNGLNRPGLWYSSVDEIVPPVDIDGNYSLVPGSAYAPEEQIWIYTAENPADFFSSGISGSQRLPNGNTLICDGQGGVFFEVTQQKETVWEYVNSFPNQYQNNVFKVRRYGRDYPGLLDLIQPHDVAIPEVTLDKTSVMKGQEVSIETTVENQGIYIETFNVTISANSTQIERERIQNMSVGASYVFNFSWDTTSFAAGNYTISAEADVVVNETDTLDNVLIAGVVHVRVLHHDIAVMDSVFLKNIVGQGYSTYTNATLRNQGDYVETFNVTLNTSSTVIDLLTNISLANRTSTSIILSWNTTGYTLGNYTVKVHACPVTGEIDLEDNILSSWIIITIPGDVDGNRQVDIFDIVMIASVYSKTQGEPEYVANCDINGDGTIDIFDVVIAAGNYGESW
jgi:hypothetical protein